MKKIFGTASAVLLASVAAMTAFVGCASAPKAEAPAVDVGPLNESTKTGMDAIPAEELAKAAGMDEEEAAATTTMADCVLEPWALNDNRHYIQDEENAMYIVVQYEGSDWAKDITASKAELIDVGDGDKAAAFNLGLSKDGHKYGILMNISKQGSAPIDISGMTLKMRVYIPEELVLANKEGFVPTLSFAIRDTSWAQYFLNGGLDKVTFADIGTGWHTITIDFANGTYDLGSKQGTFRPSSVAAKKCNMIDLYIQGKKIDSNLDVPILIDWINLSK